MAHFNWAYLAIRWEAKSKFSSEPSTTSKLCLCEQLRPCPGYISEPRPAGTQLKSNVTSMSMRHHDITLTPIRHCFDSMCLLGLLLADAVSTKSHVLADRDPNQHILELAYVDQRWYRGSLG